MRTRLMHTDLQHNNSSSLIHKLTTEPSDDTHITDVPLHGCTCATVPDLHTDTLQNCDIGQRVSTAPLYIRMIQDNCIFHTLDIMHVCDALLTGLDAMSFWHRAKPVLRETLNGFRNLYCVVSST